MDYFNYSKTFPSGTKMWLIIPSIHSACCLVSCFVIFERYTTSRPALLASYSSQTHPLQLPYAVSKPLKAMPPFLRSTQEQEVIIWSGGCLTETENFFFSTLLPSRHVVYLRPSLFNSFTSPPLFV